MKKFRINEKLTGCVFRLIMTQVSFKMKLFSVEIMQFKNELYLDKQAVGNA